MINPNSSGKILQTPHLASLESGVETTENSNRYPAQVNSKYFQNERKQLEQRLVQTQRQLTSMQTAQDKSRKKKKKLKHEVAALKK